VEQTQTHPPEFGSTHATIAHGSYTCQLGRKKEAWNWLEKAFDAATDPKPIKTMALDDPDLEPLWLDIAEWQLQYRQTL
jgi:hypothetical protein